MEVSVSVLVPVYNGEKYIRELLESVSRQKHRSIELVIVDDHSDDHSYELCRKWCMCNKSRFADIKLKRNEKNIGLSGTTNILMELAGGDFLFLADQDDVWLPEKVKRQTQYMMEHEDCIISLTDRSITDKDLNIKIKSEFSYLNYSLKSMDFSEFIKHRNNGTSANKMCIRGGFEDKLKIPENILEHDRFMAAMAVCIGTIDYIYEPLVLYRIHENNLSGNYSIESSANVVDCFLCQYQLMKRYKLRDMDEPVIEREMKNRFGIDLSLYNHRFLSREKNSRSVLINAINATADAVKKGVIGKWRG